MCKVCSSLGQKWGNERAITGSKIILTSPFSVSGLPFLALIVTGFACSVHLSTPQTVKVPSRLPFKLDSLKSARLFETFLKLIIFVSPVLVASLALKKAIPDLVMLRFVSFTGCDEIFLSTNKLFLMVLLLMMRTVCISIGEVLAFRSK